MKNLFKNILFGGLLMVLLMPLAQQKFHFVQELPLSGAIVDAPFANFSMKGWWDGSYQEGKSDYLNDHMGLRSYLIKLNNQFDFDILKKVHANGVVIGQHNFLYEKAYIDAYCGLHYENDNGIRKKLIQLKKIQDTLAGLGKKLIFIHAPSKAWFYPNEFPYLLKCTQTRSIYKDCIRIEDSLKINSIDFNAYFLKMRDTSKHLLFSKQGTHWTHYGAMIAADSMVKYLKRTTGKKLPRLVFDKYNISDTALPIDIDIAKGINLWNPIAYEKFTYTEHHFQVDSTTERINTIYIGDSFFWTFYYNYIPHGFNKDYEFWYYFDSIWFRKNGTDGGGKIESYDWVASVNNTDVVVLLFTEINLENLGNGFIEKAYQHYYPEDKLQ